MSLRKNPRSPLALASMLLAGAFGLMGQSAFLPLGEEYRLAGNLGGDQVKADFAMGNAGGIVVWQDSTIDGSGTGIAAARLNSSVSSGFSPFRMNNAADGNQEAPRIARLRDGGYAVVWQGGVASMQQIFARFLNPDGTFASLAEQRVNTHVGTGKLAPAVSGLSDGGAVVVWSSYGQDDADNPVRSVRGLLGVYGQLLDSSGAPVGGEFLINTTRSFNQRTPAVATLSDGRFVVVWVSERLSGYGESEVIEGVNVVGRVFGANGQPEGGEFSVNSSANVCANPSIAPAADGGFTIAWSESITGDIERSWEVHARHYLANGTPRGTAYSLNTHGYGDQFGPRLATAGSQQLAVWTSLGQDGSWEGVFGRFLISGEPVGGEFRINQLVASRQLYPVVASYGEEAFAVVWSTFTGLDHGMDLAAQRFATTIPAPGAPVVVALSANELGAAWPALGGLDVDRYLLFVDGSAQPLEVDGIYHVFDNLLPESVREIRLAYRLTDGRVSPLSAATTGKTWGRDMNWDGLPDDWQKLYFGASGWPSPLLDSDGDGMTNLQEFLAGTDPQDALSVLRLTIRPTDLGLRLDWNTSPGLVYRLQSSSDFNDWLDVGALRFSPGNQDSHLVQDGSSISYYRVIRIR